MAGFFEDVHRDENGKWVMNNAAPETTGASNAPSGLATKGAGQFTSVDDYLDKTGQRAINDANRLASYDSQQRAAGNTPSLADIQAAMNDPVNKFDVRSGNVPSPYQNDDEFNRLSAKMQQSGTNYSRSHPTEYASANDAVDDYTKTIAQMEADARAFASRFGDENSNAYRAAYAMKTSQDDGYNSLVSARDAALKDSEQSEEDKRIRELFGDDKTDIETLRIMYQTLMDAQQRDEQRRINPAGSLDTMNWDNSFNQNQTVNGQPAPTYDPVTNYNLFSGNSEVNRLRREAQRNGLVWGSPEFEDYVRQRLNNG